jgi:DNA-binding IclR family transcriptional regulator
MRGAQLIRQWKLLRLLATHPEGLSVVMLCHALKARKRTLYRDLTVLKKAGFTIQKLRAGKEALYFVPHPERLELRAFLRTVRPDLSIAASREAAP